MFLARDREDLTGSVGVHGGYAQSYDEIRPN
jgi:hypothetical protein